MKRKKESAVRTGHTRPELRLHSRSLEHTAGGRAPGRRHMREGLRRELQGVDIEDSRRGGKKKDHKTCLAPLRL